MMRPTNPMSKARLSAALGGLVLIVAACSTGSGASSAPSAAPSVAAPSVAAPSAAAGGEAYVVAVANGTVGAYLTGEDGKTLYTFKPDSANKSTCVDTCATNWPPFIVEGDDTLKPGDGVAGQLTTFARADGKMQVAYNGAPLYYFAKDTKAGDTVGQGVGDKWFVASPTGTAPAGASPSSGGRSY